LYQRTHLKVKRIVIYSMQIRAARALLGIGQAELAKMAGVGVGTIKRMESPEAEITGSIGTLVRITRACENAGVVFIDDNGVHGPGVRLRQPLQRE